MTSSRLPAALLWLSAGLLACSSAGTPSSPTLAPAPAAAPAAASGLLLGQLAEGSAYDRIWSVPVLYKDPHNPWLQELALQGQLQTQYAYGSDDAGQFGSGDLPEASNWGDIEVRRFRLGARALLFNSLKLHTLLDIYPDLSPRIYKDTAEAYLTYTASDAFSVSVGKTELKFTREQEISSREILTFERSQLVNLFYGGELTGAWLAGKGLAGGWLYELGAYSNARVDEFSSLQGGTIILAKIGYNYTQASGCDYAQAALHYLHNSDPGYVAGPGCATSPGFSNGLTLSNDLTMGRFSLTTEAFWGQGDNRPNVGGVSAIPAWYLTKQLQLVGLFELATSNEATGIPLPYRYEQQVPSGKAVQGDLWCSAYAGLNYYLYGHKLKVMSGVKYANLSGGDNDFNGWTWLAGFRTAF